jgi:hypothetical protein
MSHDCCAHCLLSLGLGPRLQRILAYLIKHADEWERGELPGGERIEALRFRYLDRARNGDVHRVMYRVELRDHPDDDAA